MEVVKEKAVADIELVAVRVMAAEAAKRERWRRVALARVVEVAALAKVVAALAKVVVDTAWSTCPRSRRTRQAVCGRRSHNCLVPLGRSPHPMDSRGYFGTAWSQPTICDTASRRSCRHIDDRHQRYPIHESRCQPSRQSRSSTIACKLIAAARAWPVSQHHLLPEDRVPSAPWTWHHHTSSRR